MKLENGKLGSEAQAAVGGLAVLFDLHRLELHRFLKARCNDREQADDLLQELWIKVSSQPAKPLANGRAYIFRMANNLVLDQLRARQRAMVRDREWIDTEAGGASTLDDRPDPDLPADEALIRQQEAALLGKAVAELPPGAQRALRLHRFDGHGHAEVAQIMGISRSGVEKHLAVAMKHLKKSLMDYGFFASAASDNEKPEHTGEQPQDMGK